MSMIYKITILIFLFVTVSCKPVNIIDYDDFKNKFDVGHDIEDVINEFGEPEEVYTQIIDDEEIEIYVYSTRLQNASSDKLQSVSISTKEGKIVWSLRSRHHVTR